MRVLRVIGRGHVEMGESAGKRFQGLRSFERFLVIHFLHLFLPFGKAPETTPLGLSPDNAYDSSKMYSATA